MANIELKPTDIYTISLGLKNPADGSVEAIPAGDVFSVVASSSAIEGTVGTDAAGGPAVVLHALTLPSVNTMGMNITVSDSAGDVVLVQGVDYPVPAAPGDIALDVAAAVVTTQTAPTAAGP